MVSIIHTKLAAVPTYSAAIGSSGDDVVLEFEVRIEDGGIQLRFAIELVTHSLPVGCRF